MCSAFGALSFGALGALVCSAFGALSFGALGALVCSAFGALSVLAGVSRCVVAGLASVRGSAACSEVAGFDGLDSVLAVFSWFVRGTDFFSADVVLVVRADLLVLPPRAATTPLLKSPGLAVAAIAGRP